MTLYIHIKREIERDREREVLHKIPTWQWQKMPGNIGNKKKKKKKEKWTNIF